MNVSGDPAPERVAETGSTNDDLLARVRAAAASGATTFAPCLLVADRQRAGRGRHGRRWHATPDASLTFSIAWPCARSDLSGLSLAVGCALADALDVARPRRCGSASSGRTTSGSSTPRAPARRHAPPPDPLAARPKAASSPASSSRRRRSAAAASPSSASASTSAPRRSPTRRRASPASTRSTREATPATTLARVAPALFAALRAFDAAGFAAFADRFAARDVLRGRRVAGTGAHGEVEGVAAGIGADGSLRIDTAAGADRGRQRRMAPRSHRAGGFAMLRALLALLIVANLLFFAFSRGALDGLLGLRALGDREPERLANQVRPQTIRLLPIGGAASAARSTPACRATRRRPSPPATPPRSRRRWPATCRPAAGVDNRGERNLGTRTEVTHTYRVIAADADAGGAAGDAEARRRRARLQLQSVRAGRAAAALSARRARAPTTSASESTAASRSSSQPTPSAPPPPDDVAAGGVDAGGVTTTARRPSPTASWSRRSRVLSVVVSWITNEPAAVGVTTTESPSLAPVIVAPVVPALRIVQA